jgi:hypothetical protein
VWFLFALPLWPGMVNIFSYFFSHLDFYENVLFNLVALFFIGSLIFGGSLVFFSSLYLVVFSLV